MKILEFKTVSPLFEMERDGDKPFTVRKIEPKDKRHRALAHWQLDYKWGIKIVNPATGESFIREIKAVSYVRYVDMAGENIFNRIKSIYDWRIIVFGDVIQQ